MVSIQDQADLDLAKSFGHVCCSEFRYGICKRCEDTPYYSLRTALNARIWHAREFVQNNAIRSKLTAVQGRGYNVPQSLEELTKLEKITNPAHIAELKRIEDEKIAKELAEKAQKALMIKLENQRIADEQAEIKRLFDVAELQRQAEINAENLRIKLLKEEYELQDKILQNRLQKINDKETQRIEKAIPLLASIIPLSAIGLLLLYTSKGKL
jgi:hypothetical protein